MCVYNGEDYLNEAIDSILAQTFKDFELLIIDDCSSDKSLDILAKYNDPRIRLIVNDENIGLTKSLNKGLTQAQGKYIARMDADDICTPSRLQRQLEVFEKNKSIALVFGDTVFIDKNSEKICPSYRPKSIDKILKNLEINNFIPHPTVMFLKSKVVSMGGYNEEMITAQDLDLWVRMRDQGLKFEYINATLLEYRLNPNSVRKGAYENYWFTVCKYCISNYSKKNIRKYFLKLTISQKLKIILRLLIPTRFYWFRLL